MAYGDYPDLSKVKKVLVIKLRQLGDALLAVPVLTALKAHLPDARIDAYVYTEAFPLLEGNPSLGKLIGYDRSWKRLSFTRRLFREISLLRSLSQEGYDLVINLTEGDRGALAAFFSRSTIRVGFSPKGRFQKNLYTHIVKHCPSLRHNVERNLDALRRVGIFPSYQERDLVVPSSPTYPIEGPFVLIHPTSRWKFKCWSIENMRALTKELLLRGKKVVFTSGPDRDELAMIEQITCNLPVLNLAGKISLKELSSLVAQSECLVCVDSLPFHLASAHKAKVVALFGPTSEVSWGPWRNPNAVVLFEKLSCRPCHLDGCGGSKRSECLTSLPVSRVIGAIDHLLHSQTKVFSEIGDASLPVS